MNKNMHVYLLSSIQGFSVYQSSIASVLIHDIRKLLNGRIGAFLLQVKERGQSLGRLLQAPSRLAPLLQDPHDVLHRLRLAQGQDAFVGQMWEEQVPRVSQWVLVTFNTLDVLKESFFGMALQKRDLLVFLTSI